MPVPSLLWVYADVASDCSPLQPGSKATASQSLLALIMIAPEPCSGNSAASPNSSWIRWPPEYHASLVAAFGLFQFARFLDAEVEQGAKVRMHSSSVDLGLPLCFPTGADGRLVPRASSFVAGSQFGPFCVNGSLSFWHSGP